MVGAGRTWVKIGKKFRSKSAAAPLGTGQTDKAGGGGTPGRTVDLKGPGTSGTTSGPKDLAVQPYRILVGIASRQLTFEVTSPRYTTQIFT